MKINKIIPRAKQVLVLPDPAESRQNKNGIITPDNIEQERKAFGEVVAVGSDVKDIKKGDRVVYAVFAGEVLTMDKKEFKLLPDEEILAFLK